jgi:hypothetical protein
MLTKETLDTLKYILLLLSPVILIQIGMAVYALIDLARRAKTRGPRWAWALGLIVTIFGVPSGIIVSGIYLAWGRHAEG